MGREDPSGYGKNACFCESYVFLRVFSHSAGWGVTGKGGKGDRVNPILEGLTRLDPEGRRIFGAWGFLGALFETLGRSRGSLRHI